MIFVSNGFYFTQMTIGVSDQFCLMRFCHELNCTLMFLYEKVDGNLMLFGQEGYGHLMLFFKGHYYFLMFFLQGS
ncbi:hypothetical protein D3C85_1586780 [compost metagenome]